MTKKEIEKKTTVLKIAIHGSIEITLFWAICDWVTRVQGSGTEGSKPSLFARPTRYFFLFSISCQCPLLTLFLFLILGNPKDFHLLVSLYMKKKI